MVDARKPQAARPKAGAGAAVSMTVMAVSRTVQWASRSQPTRVNGATAPSVKLKIDDMAAPFDDDLCRAPPLPADVVAHCVRATKIVLAKR
jgi:hypothetical protein